MNTLEKIIKVLKTFDHFEEAKMLETSNLNEHEINALCIGKAKKCYFLHMVANSQHYNPNNSGYIFFDNVLKLTKKISQLYQEDTIKYTRVLYSMMYRGNYFVCADAVDFFVKNQFLLENCNPTIFELLVENYIPIKNTIYEPQDLKKVIEALNNFNQHYHLSNAILFKVLRLIKSVFYTESNRYELIEQVLNNPIDSQLRWVQKNPKKTWFLFETLYHPDFEQWKNIIKINEMTDSQIKLWSILMSNHNIDKENIQERLFWGYMVQNYPKFQDIFIKDINKIVEKHAQTIYVEQAKLFVFKSICDANNLKANYVGQTDYWEYIIDSVANEYYLNMKPVVYAPPKNTATNIHEETKQRDLWLLNDKNAELERQKAQTPLQKEFLSAEIRIAQYKKENGLL